MYANTSPKNSPQLAVASVPAWTEPWAKGDPHARTLLNYLFGDHGSISDREVRETLIQLSAGSRPTAELPERSGVAPTNQVRDVSMVMLGVKGEASPDILCALAYCGLTDDPKELMYATVKRALDTLMELRPQAGLRLAYALTHCELQNDKVMGIDVLQEVDARLYFQRCYELVHEGIFSDLVREQLINNVNSLIPTCFPDVPPIDENWQSRVRPDSIPDISQLAGVVRPPLFFQREAEDMACIIESKDDAQVERAFERLCVDRFEFAIVAAAGRVARHSFPTPKLLSVLADHAPVFSEAVGLLPGKPRAAAHFSPAQKPSNPISDPPA